MIVVVVVGNGVKGPKRSKKAGLFCLKDWVSRGTIDSDIGLGIYL